MGLRNWLRNWIGSDGGGSAAAGGKPVRGSARLRSWLARWFDRLPQPATVQPAPVVEAQPPAPTQPVIEWTPLTVTPEPTEPETLPGPQWWSSPNDDTTLAGRWVHLNSSNVDSIRYRRGDSVLEVTFRNGSHYEYYAVPEQVFLDFLDTASPGRFVWQVLRAGGYAYQRLGGAAGAGAYVAVAPPVARVRRPRKRRVAS